MKYDLTKPCPDCPFLKKHRRAYTEKRLHSLIGEGSFHCHKTGIVDEESGDFVPTEDSSHCAGALIYFEKRKAPNQMMRIAERLGMYDRTKLDMDAPVR